MKTKSSNGNRDTTTKESKLERVARKASAQLSEFAQQVDTEMKRLRGWQRTRSRAVQCDLPKSPIATAVKAEQQRSAEAISNPVTVEKDSCRKKSVGTSPRFTHDLPRLRSIGLQKNSDRKSSRKHGRNTRGTRLPAEAEDTGAGADRDAFAKDKLQLPLSFCFDYTPGDGLKQDVTPDVDVYPLCQCQHYSGTGGGSPALCNCSCQCACQHYNGGVVCNQRRYVERGVSPCRAYNYCRDEYYYDYPTAPASRIVCCPPAVPPPPRLPIANPPSRCCTCVQANNNDRPRSHSRRRSDLNTETFYQAKRDTDRTMTTTTRSTTTERREHDSRSLNRNRGDIGAAKKGNAKQLKDQYVQSERKRSVKQPPGEEAAQSSKDSRKSTRSGGDNGDTDWEHALRQKLRQASADKIAKLLIGSEKRHRDRHDGSKRAATRSADSEDSSSLQGYRVKSKEKLLKITVSKQRRLRCRSCGTDCDCDADYDDYKGRDPEYSVETLRAMKRLRIISYKPPRSVNDEGRQAEQKQEDPHDKVHSTDVTRMMDKNNGGTAVGEKQYKRAEENAEKAVNLDGKEEVESVLSSATPSPKEKSLSPKDQSLSPASEEEQPVESSAEQTLAPEWIAGHEQRLPNLTESPPNSGSNGSEQFRRDAMFIERQLANTSEQRQRFERPGSNEYLPARLLPQPRPQPRPQPNQPAPRNPPEVIKRKSGSIRQSRLPTPILSPRKATASMAADRHESFQSVNESDHSALHRYHSPRSSAITTELVQSPATTTSVTDSRDSISVLERTWLSYADQNAAATTNAKPPDASQLFSPQDSATRQQQMKSGGRLQYSPASQSRESRERIDEVRRPDTPPTSDNMKTLAQSAIANVQQSVASPLYSPQDSATRQQQMKSGGRLQYSPASQSRESRGERIDEVRRPETPPTSNNMNTPAQSAIANVQQSVASPLYSPQNSTTRQQQLNTAGGRLQYLPASQSRESRAGSKDEGRRPETSPISHNKVTTPASSPRARHQHWETAAYGSPPAIALPAQLSDEASGYERMRPTPTSELTKANILKVEQRTPFDHTKEFAYRSGADRRVKSESFDETEEWRHGCAELGPYDCLANGYASSGQMTQPSFASIDGSESSWDNCCTHEDEAHWRRDVQPQRSFMCPSLFPEFSSCPCMIDTYMQIVAACCDTPPGRSARATVRCD